MKFKVFAVGLAVMVVSLFAVVATASAQTFRSNQSVSVASGDSINGSAYLAGSSVDVAGKVDGDLYCAGQNITISGQVTGDVLCAGQSLTISGSVAGNIRAAGQTVTVSGSVGKGVSLAGQTIIIQKGAQIGRDATILGQSVNIDGRIGRDLVLTSASATLNSLVTRNVTAQVETLHLAKNATIGGTLNYTSPQRLTSESGAVVSGKTTYTEATKNTNSAKAAYNPAAAIFWSFMLLVSAIIFALIFPRLLHTATQASSESVSRAFLTILVGFVATIMVPVTIFLLMITVVAIPFALVALCAWLLVLALSGAFTAYFTGRIVWRTQTNAVLIMLVGALIITLLLLIPIVNIIVGIVSIWYGSGALLLHLKRNTPVPSYTMNQQPTKAKRKTAGA